MRLIGHEEKDENEMSTTTTQTTTSVNIVPTKNKGSNSTLSYPLSLGQVTLASIYDEKYKKYTDVDVTALRYLSSEEATILADENSNRELIEGFRWHGFEYRVQLNDLDYLQNDGISPLLNSKIYNLDGSDFVNVNGVNYRLVTTPIIDGDKIHNNESAVVKLIYQIPIDKSDFVICFGYYKETMGCFR